MSKLHNLREAIVKLSEAEEALLKARNSFKFGLSISRPSVIYDRLDHQWERVGDAIQILEDILAKEESESLQELQALANEEKP